MSTVDSGVKWKFCQSDLKTERGSAAGGGSLTEGQKAGGFRESRGKKCITRASTECVQTTKNLHIRRRTLLKSKEEWRSTPENRDERLGHPRFTSFFSLRFPSTGRDRANARVATKLRSNDLHTNTGGPKVDDVQHRECGEKDFLVDTLGESTGKATKEENVSESHSDTIFLRENHVKHGISSHRSTDGIQRGLALCVEGQPAHKNCTQGQFTGSERVTEPQVTGSESVEGQSGVNDPLGQNAEGTLLSHSNLILFTEETGSKADSDSQVCAGSPAAINQPLSLPSFPDSHNLKSDLITLSAAMFTSTLVSVLAPHWSGRFRRHKRGFSDVGPDGAQNANLSATSQNEQQQRFPLQQIQVRGDPSNTFSNRLRGSTGTRRNSADWQNESLSHVSESKKQFLKTFNKDRHTVEQTTGYGNPINVSVDSTEVPKSTLSHQLSDHRRMEQSVDQGTSFSSLRSRPTTSTMLLSSRRMNAKKPSLESLQMKKQLSESLSSLNLPSESILRISQPQPKLVSPNYPAEETPVPKSIQQLSHKTFSTEREELDSSRKHRYLITGDFDRMNRTPPATNNTPRERLISTYATRLNQSERLRSEQDYRAVDQSITDNKNQVPERSVWVSPNENANSRFVFPHVSSNLNSDSIHNSQINKTSMASTHLSPSFSVQSNGINDMINLNKTSTTNGTTSPQTVPSASINPSVSLTSASRAVQGNILNSSGLEKASSSPVSSIRTRTFTESLSFSPRNDSFVEATSPNHLWSNYLNSKRESKESNQSPLDQTSPLSSSEFKPRKVCTPSIYKYLRETSPSPGLSSASPESSSLKQIHEEDKNSQNQWFTFDFSPLKSRDLHLKPDPSSTSSPKSLPPDNGTRSVPRLSKSPYSTLISTRVAANSLSSPPVSHQHSRSYSYDSTPVGTKSPKVEKRSYTSVLRERMSQRKPSLGEPVGSTDIQVPVKTVPLSPMAMSINSKDVKFPESQTTTLIQDTHLHNYPTHPDQTDAVFKNIPHERVNRIFLSHGDKSNTDRLNSREISMPLGTSPASEVVPKGGVTEMLQTNGTFQASQSPNSKRSLFWLRSKKDNAPASSLSADKEGLAVKNGEMTGPKTSKRVDQVLNRLRLTFGGKVSEDSDSSRRKTKKEEASNVKAYDNVKKENEGEDLTVERPTEKVLYIKDPEISRKQDQVDYLTVRAQTKPEISIRIEQIDYVMLRTQPKPEKAPEMFRKIDQTDYLTDRTRTKSEKYSDTKAPEISRKLDQLDHQIVRTQYKPEMVLDIKAPERSRKLDPLDDPMVRTQTKPEMTSEIKTPEITRKLDQLDYLTVRTQLNPEKVSHKKAPEISSKLDQMYRQPVRAQTKPEMDLDIKNPEITRKLEQTDGLLVKTRLDIKAPERRSRTLDQIDYLMVRSQSKPEMCLDIKAPERSRKTDLIDDLMIRAQTKPEKTPERKLDPVDDLSVRRKTKNKTHLDLTSETRRFSESQTLKSPNSRNTQMVETYNSSGPTLGFRPEKQDNSPNMDKDKRLTEENRSQFVSRSLSPNWPKPDNINCYATLPQGKRSRLNRTPRVSSYEWFSEDEQNDVFFSNVLTKRSKTSLGDPENVSQPDNSVMFGGQNSTGVVSSPCADLKYGLQRGRSVSVCSIVSGRPSGPGRISTGSRQGSVSDLSSLDGFVTKSRHSSTNSPVGSPENDVTASTGHVSYKGRPGRLSSEGRLKSPDNLEAMTFQWDTEADPMPPLSPLHTRRISQISSPSSAGSWNSPDSLSPRGFLPSRNYKSMLSAFEESDSETTTDGEYFLNSDDDDGNETEL